MSTTRNMTMIALWIIVVFETLFAICIFPPVRQALDSMFAYQIWDLLIKVLGSIATFFAAGVVYWRWNDEKNRAFYEKQLSKVYAPLYGLVIKQETIREVNFPRITRKAFPIIWPSIESYEERENGSCVFKVGIQPPEGDLKKKYIEILNNESCGFARPQLIKLINQLEILNTTKFMGTIELDKYKGISDKYNSKLLRMKRKVEGELINEIIDGYQNLQKKLGVIEDEYIIEIDKLT